jgi:hypothetical protein
MEENRQDTSSKLSRLYTNLQVDKLAKFDMTANDDFLPLFCRTSADASNADVLIGKKTYEGYHEVGLGYSLLPEIVCRFRERALLANL